MGRTSSILIFLTIAICGLNSFNFVFATDDEKAILDDSCPQPSHCFDDVENQQHESIGTMGHEDSPRKSSVIKRNKTSGNPITSYGVSLSDFFEHGLIHMDNPDDLLSQTSENADNPNNKYVVKYYKRKSLPLSNEGKMSTLLPISADESDDSCNENKEQEDDESDDQPDEEEVDIPELASGN